MKIIKYLPGTLVILLGFLVSTSSLEAQYNYITLKVPSGGQTLAYGISDGNIVGYTTMRSISYGFIYNGSSYTLLPGGTFALGIDGENVVGTYSSGTGSGGFVYNISNNDYPTFLAYPGALNLGFPI